MTVSELIDMLERLPQDALIGVQDADYYESLVYPIQIVKDDCVIDHTIGYCANQEDFDNGETCDVENVCDYGYCLLANPEDIRYSYMLLDDDGIPMPETEEWAE